MGELLSEMGCEKGGFGSCRGQPSQDLVEAGDFSGLAFKGGGETGGAIGVEQTGGSDFRQALLGQVVEARTRRGRSYYKPGRWKSPRIAI